MKSFYQLDDFFDVEFDALWFLLYKMHVIVHCDRVFNINSNIILKIF